jgi:molecular chaperone DnaK
LQGERKMAGDNKSIGRFHLDGIPPAPRGVPQVEVTFDLNADGILHVSAKDLGTGKEQKITITASSGLSDKEIDDMVQDAEKFADEDEKKRESVEVKNQAENIVYQTEKLLKEQEDKVDKDKVGNVESAIADLKKAIEGEDVDDMKAKMEVLNTEMQAVSADLYAQAKTDAEGEPEDGAPESEVAGDKKKEDEGEVIDADYEMVDDDKDKNKKKKK